MTNKHETIDEYIGDCDERVVSLLKELREFIHAEMPGATERMQYGTPLFTNAHGIPVIYLYGSKRHVNFGFLRSADLADPDGVLRGSGKPSKHIKVFPDKPYDTTLLSDFISQSKNMQS